MTEFQRRLTIIHGLALVLLFATWLAGVSIAPHAGTPMVALYYVMHIFTAGVILVLILLQWQISSQKQQIFAPGSISYRRWNHLIHQAYDAILVALPITGLLIFYEPKALASVPGVQPAWWVRVLHDSFFHHVHAWLFNGLLALVVVNAVALMITRRK
jgi:hypothetical protein